MVATIKAAVFRYKIETAVLILPVATMIAFAQLRTSMPNVPAGFGEINFPQGTVHSTLMRTYYTQATNIG